MARTLIATVPAVYRRCDAVARATELIEGLSLA